MRRKEWNVSLFFIFESNYRFVVSITILISQMVFPFHQITRIVEVVVRFFFWFPIIGF